MVPGLQVSFVLIMLGLQAEDRAQSCPRIRVGVLQLPRSDGGEREQERGDESGQPHRAQ